MKGCRNQLKSWGMVLVAILLATTVSGCGSRDAESSASDGITPERVKIGQSCPVSGAASAYAVFCESAAAYFDWVNSEGGVKMLDGKPRKIELVQYDDAYLPEKLVENARRLVEQDRVFAVFQPIGTPTSAAVIDYLNDSEVPMLYVASGSSRWGDRTNFPWTIGWSPAYSTEGAIYVEYLKATRPNARVAILMQNDDYGRDSVAGFEDALKGTSIRIVAKEMYQATDPSVSSQMLKLSKSDADVFLNITTPKFATQAIKRKAELKWDVEQILAAASASTSAVLEPAGIHNAKGIVSAAYLKDVSDPVFQDDPDVQEYLDLAKRFGKFDPNDPFAVRGWTTGATLVEALRATREPTKEGLMAAVADMEVDLPLLLPGVSVKTAEDDAYPLEAMQLQRFDGIQWELFGDVFDYEGRTVMTGS